MISPTPSGSSQKSCLLTAAPSGERLRQSGTDGLRCADQASVAGCDGSDLRKRKYAVLTDIQGLEDHLGDMDFKVAGTRRYHGDADGHQDQRFVGSVADGGSGPGPNAPMEIMVTPRQSPHHAPR